MRITVLTYLEEDGGKPDVVVPQVADALREKGHEVTILGIYDDVNKLIAGLEESKPDAIFNLMEMFGENLFGAAYQFAANTTFAILRSHHDRTDNPDVGVQL